MPNRKIEERIAAARTAHRDAAATDRAARRATSSKLLKTLLAKPDTERLDALAPGSKIASHLVAEDRLKLLKSMRKQEIKFRTIAADFATPFELFRSRLRFRIWPIIVCGLVLASGIAIAAVAYVRTPEALVVVAGGMLWDVTRTHPDGTSETDTIDARKKTVYGMVRREGDMGVLRVWAPGRGYDTFKLPLSTLAYAR